MNAKWDSEQYCYKQTDGRNKPTACASCSPTEGLGDAARSSRMCAGSWTLQMKRITNLYDACSTRRFIAGNSETKDYDDHGFYTLWESPVWPRTSCPVSETYQL